MELIENRTFDEIEIGDTATLERTLSEQDIMLFAVMSGDINPAHVDPEYAMSSRFREVIGHGMWSGALISTVLGTDFPGPGTIYLSQNLRFPSAGPEPVAQLAVKARFVAAPVAIRARFARRGCCAVFGSPLSVAGKEKVTDGRDAARRGQS